MSYKFWQQLWGSKPENTNFIHISYAIEHAVFMVSWTNISLQVERNNYRTAVYQGTYFKGPEVLDKATHPIMPKVQNINTSNTPSPIPATKVIFYINQNSKRSSVYDRVAKLNLAAILDFEDASCRVLKMSWTNFGLAQCYICGTLSTQAKPNPSWILKTNWLLKNQGGGGFKSRRS